MHSHDKAFWRHERLGAWGVDRDMKHALSPSLRPASTAIAAVLVLLSTPSFAQEAAPVVPVPTAPDAPIVAAPPAVAPTVSAPSAVAPPPVVQTVQPATIPEETAEPVVATSAPPVRRAAAQREQARPAPIAEPVAATPAPVIERTAPAPTSNGLPTERVAPVPPVATTISPEIANTVATTDDGMTMWFALGGLALLAGGAVYALRRRRPSRERRVGDVVVTQPAHPVVADAFAPVSVSPDEVPVPQRAPVATGVAAGDASNPEALAALPPSPENPFLTRKNRLRRARWLLAHGGMESATPKQRPLAAGQPEVAQVNRGVTYDFGKAGRKPSPPQTSRPLWT